MHPAGAAAGGAMMVNVRAVARANIILGLAMAAIALLAATINPGDFHPQPQIMERAAPASAPASGAQQCGATEADALYLRKEALKLVLKGVVQAVFAAAADVAVTGSLPVLGPCLAVLAHVVGAFNAWSLCDVVNGAAVVAIGHCAGGGYLTYLVILSYVLVAMSYAVLLGASLAVTLCWW